MQASRAVAAAEPRKPFYKHLYVQVLTAIVLGVLLGHFYPQLGEQMKPLGDGFIKLIKMLIAPIIFCTVVHGIASMEDMKKVGRVGLKALVYFEVMTTLALIVGLMIVNVLQPGVGMNVDPRAHRYQDRSRSTRPRPASRARSIFSCTSSRTRWSGRSPKARSCRFCSSPSCSPSGCSCWASAVSRVLNLIDTYRTGLFNVVGIIMKVAPIGAFGAMAFTIRQVRRRHAAVARQADGWPST